jgi:hypothetical protein
MTRFVHIDYPSEHPGVIRAEATFARGHALASGTRNALGKLGRSVTSSGGLTLLALAAVVAALVLVADRLVDTWADDHLFAAWVALWTLIFATLAVFAPLAKGVIDRTLTQLATWRKRAAEARDEAAFLETAQRDPRVMSELRAAILRHEAAQIEAFGDVEPHAALDRLMNSLPPSKRYLRYI